jgi:hypothetical protein
MQMHKEIFARLPEAAMESGAVFARAQAEN